MRFGFFAVLFLCAASLYAQPLPSGIVWDDEKYLSLPLKYDFGETPKPLPKSQSLKEFCPRVVNQRSFATSAVWASVWYGQSMAAAASCLEGDQIKITQNAFSPSFPYRMVNSGADCATPVNLVSIFETLATYGAPRFSQFDDLCPSNVPGITFSQALENKIDGYIKLFNLFDTQDLKVNAVKKALHSNHPVVVGMITPPSFSLAGEFWQPREKPDSIDAAQALCVVGYDDKKFGGAVEVVNQWGKSWGNEGFTWIRYADFALFARYGFELIYSASCLPLPDASVVIYGNNGKVIDQLPIANEYHQVKEKLKVGSRFRISIRAQSGVFAYFLLREEAKVTTLFPSATVHPYITQTITLPSKEVYYQLEGQPQTNELYMIVSRRQLDPHLLQAQIENGSLVTKSASNESSLTVNDELKDVIRVAMIQIDQY